MASNITYIKIDQSELPFSCINKNGNKRFFVSGIWSHRYYYLKKWIQTVQITVITSVEYYSLVMKQIAILLINQSYYMN